MSKNTLCKIFSSVENYFSPKLGSSTQNFRTFCTEFKKMYDVIRTLGDIGYAFSHDGKLRKIGKCGMVTNEPYCFDISDDLEECQAHYEKLGVVITNYVYQSLATLRGMRRLPVPQNSTPENGTFIFVSKDYDVKDVLVILIQGSGAVRAGQWSRALIINDSIDNGSQIPYIKKAERKNYGIMILNPNDNVRDNNQKIPNSGTAEEHAKYVWENYVKETKASKILIVAHSFGGIVTVALANQYQDDFEQRVVAIAMTDSVHGYSNFKISDYLKRVSRNWISSSALLDTPMKTPNYDITRVSAGHHRHEMTSAKCIESVFKFFDEKLSAK